MINLPFPDKILWPNGRGNHFTKARAVKKHREWARIATLAAKPTVGDGPVYLVVTIHPKTRHAIDTDNVIAAMKSYQDGIADALRINDSRFAAPSIIFGPPEKGGRIVVRIGQ